MVNAPDSARLMIASAVMRLIETIEEENETLQSHRITSHSGFTDRKNQVLRELMIAQRRESADPITPELKRQLQRLREILHVNTQLLKHHISAVGEVSDIIVAGLKGAESDGTYSRDAGVTRWR